MCFVTFLLWSRGHRGLFSLPSLFFMSLVFNFSFPQAFVVKGSVVPTVEEDHNFHLYSSSPSNHTIFGASGFSSLKWEVWNAVCGSLGSNEKTCSMPNNVSGTKLAPVNIRFHSHLADLVPVLCGFPESKAIACQTDVASCGSLHRAQGPSTFCLPWSSLI